MDRQMNGDVCCMLLLGQKDENTSTDITVNSSHPELALPSLPVGTEVSAKYRGAFCEAKVKTVVRVVKCKVVMKDCQTSIFVTDEEIKGSVKLGSVVEVKNPETGQPVEGTINKLIDHSTYTVVFDDGDERTLRRSQLCLKGDKHFVESETLDNLPLSHPEHFGTPVLQNKKSKHKNDGEGDEWEEDSEEESPRRTMYRGRHQELVGKLMLVDFPNRKGSVIPALVVLPDANSINEVKNRDQILVRSFKDSKFMTVTRKGLKEFSRAVAIKNDDKTMRIAFEKALLYFDTKELPVGWNKEEMLGSDIEDDGDDDVEDEYASEDEPFEEKDRFVAQLYKFMEERGTPINKGPCIGNKDLNLYKLFKIVENLGGYNKVTKDMKWPVVYSKMGLPSLHQNPAHQIKTAYKKYLDAFETFYRKLGSTMGTMSRPGRSRPYSGGRSILSPLAKERSPKPKKSAEKVAQIKDETESLKPRADLSSDKPEDSQDIFGVTSTDDSDNVMRRTPRRDTKVQPVKEDCKEKKDEAEKTKKEIKKEEHSKSNAYDEKDECDVIKTKIEEASITKIRHEECTSESITKKDELIKVTMEDDEIKKEEQKSIKKVRNEEEKEKEEKNSASGSKKQILDETMEVKHEPVTPIEISLKKRLTRRKLLPAAELKIEPEVKEDMDDKIEQTKKTPIKGSKTAEKKDKETPQIMERRDNRSSEKKEPVGKVVDKKEVKLLDKIKNVEEKQAKEKKGKEDTEQDSSDDNITLSSSTIIEEESEDNVKREFPIGSKLKVKYGRGKNQKMYIAKVVDYGKDGVHQTYLVHYAGWNTRYDEWIRPDRVVAVLDKPDRSKTRTPPLRSPSAPGCMKSTPPSTSTTNTPKTLSSISKPGQVFRTPQLIAAKARATRSSSSDTSVTGKRMTRCRSVFTDSSGSKSPESNVSSDADYASDSERAGDYDNTKNDNIEDDILDVEEYEEGEEESLKGKPADASIEVEFSIPEESTPEAVSERTEEGCVKNKKEIVTDDKDKEKARIATDISEEVHQCKGFTALVKKDISKETDGSVAESSCYSDIRHKICTVNVVEVRDTVYEIRSEVLYGEEHIQCDNNSDITDTEIKSVTDISLDIIDRESTKQEIIEEKESDKKEEIGKIDSKSDQSDKIIEEICVPVLLPDEIIPQLTKEDTEQAKKDISSEKTKCARGRKNNSAKEGKKSTKTLDNTTATRSTSEIPTSDCISIPPSDKFGPSPYDFDAEVDTPWHPEITKKWEPSQKVTSAAKKVQDSLTATEEEEKDQKVKKNAKKNSLSPEFIKEEERVSVDENVSALTNIVASPLTGDTFTDSKGCKKKGRKKKETCTESKKEVVEVCESTVLETVKHSLSGLESDQALKPTGKRRTLKRVLESDQRDSNVRPAKIGRKATNIDYLDVLDNSLNVEINVINNTYAHQGPLKDTAIPWSVDSADAPCTSASAVELEENVDIKDIQQAPSYESQGFEPLLENHESNTTFDNTPPTTPEHDEERNRNNTMQHPENRYHSDDLPSKTHLHTDSMKVSSSSSSTSSSISLSTSSSNPAQLKSASESPSDNDVTSTASTDNLDATLTVQQSESSGTDQDVPSSKKRKVLEDALNSASELTRKRVHETRSTTAKKSPKYIGNSDSQGSTSNTPSHCPESPPTKFADLVKSPRPCKYNFSADLGEYLEGEAKCNFLISKMREIKAIYMNLKAEVASIDRRRKRARRKEKELIQMSGNDKEVST